MKNRRPLVLVTGPDKRLRFGWWAARLMLFLSGLRAHYVTPLRPEIPHGVRGVLIGGGDDIDPSHYGMTGDAGAEYDAARDALELEIIRNAIRCKVPILGICRGAQLLNVVMGGKLHADLRPLRKRTPNRNSLFPIKAALIQGDSRLAALMGKQKLWVNSLHHQAVDETGEGLRAVAFDSDNFVQAVESNGPDFLLGVQWHPEYLPYVASQRRLFRGLPARWRRHL
ncbi:MAG: gamma-glutamyl-gamma-aminobutyrate hydrolase family protein [Pseudomonadales bacterium]|nr:gamma-glutamyl-gamma-aminobutyrate hydrolase family protein [Pseudomonadales bacterium]